MNNFRLLYSTILSLGIALTGLVFVLFDSAWSFRQKKEIIFLSSPIKEIMGAACIVWGLWFLVVSIRAWKIERKKSISGKPEVGIKESHRRES